MWGPGCRISSHRHPRCCWGPHGGRGVIPSRLVLWARQRGLRRVPQDPDLPPHPPPLGVRPCPAAPTVGCLQRALGRAIKFSHQSQGVQEASGSSSHLGGMESFGCYPWSQSSSSCSEGISRKEACPPSLKSCGPRGECRARTPGGWAPLQRSSLAPERRGPEDSPTAAAGLRGPQGTRDLQMEHQPGSGPSAGLAGGKWMGGNLSLVGPPGAPGGAAGRRGLSQPPFL